MSEKKEEKRKENDPVLFFRVSLPETKTELSFKAFYNWDPLSSLCFVTFCFWNPNSGFLLVYQTC